MKALLLLLLLTAAARAEETPAECPKGTHRATTKNPFQPFECVKDAVKHGFGSVSGPQGFTTRPKCPRGTRPSVSGEGLQQYRCVRVLAGETEPELTPLSRGEDVPAPVEPAEDPLTRGCPPGKRKVRTNDPANPYECVARAAPVRALREDSYRRYAVPAELSFEYPRMLQPRDGWKEEVPTLSFTLDDGKPGKPVMITLTRVEPSQPTYIELDAAIVKDKEWQGAKDDAPIAAAGVKARVTVVPGEAKNAYVPLAGGAYYAVVYSAPAESYDQNLGSFHRLLKTLKLTRRSK